VSLLFDSEDCHNNGTIAVGDAQWELLEAVPLSWRDLPGVSGTLTMQNQPDLAIFAASDGTRLSVTTGGHEDSCDPWDDDDLEPARAEPPQELDRLLCAPGFVSQGRVADTGQTPDQIMDATVRGVAKVESDRPLWWWGLDPDDQVIVGVALGDATGADFQIFHVSKSLMRAALARSLGRSSSISWPTWACRLEWPGT